MSIRETITVTYHAFDKDTDLHESITLAIAERNQWDRWIPTLYVDEKTQSHQGLLVKLALWRACDAIARLIGDIQFEDDDDE